MMDYWMPLIIAIGLAISVIVFWLGWAIGRTHRTHAERPSYRPDYWTSVETSSASVPLSPPFAAGFAKMDEAFEEMDKAFKEMRQ